MTATTLKPCQDSSINPDVFFPEGPTAAQTYAQAKAICDTCPFAEPCLQDALANGVSDGVWGGMLLERGTVVPVKRPPGRPRKHAISTAA